jgi:tetratricopeptide (TPR) repeat protein
MKFQGRNQAAISATGNDSGVQPVAFPKGILGETAALLAFTLLVSSCSGHNVRPVVDGAEPESAVSDHQTRAEYKPSPEEAKKNSEATAEYHFSMAQAYVTEGNPDRAIEEFKLTLMYDPNSALVYARLATEYIKKGLLSAAMDACKQALGIDPKFTDASLMLAGLYSASHENKEALAQYDSVLRIDPKHEEAAVYRAQTLADLGKIDAATNSLRAFVKTDPEAVLAWYSLGRAEESQDRFKEAVIAYRKAIDLRPSFNQPALSLGYLYETKKMNDQAVAVYNALWEESQDSGAANRLATIYLKQEKYDLAIPFLESLQASDPDDLNASVKLGLIQMELKQYPKAIATFKAILVKTPESDRVHYYLGSLYEELQKYEEAMNELRQIKPDSKMYSDAVLHVAFLTKERKGVEEARTYINHEIERSPRVANFYVYSASLEEESKSIPQAIVLLEKAVSFFPEDEKVRYYLGSLYDRQGDQDRGLAQMEAILNVNPDNTDALNYIGYTWTQKGVRLNDAEKLLRKALALRPDNGYIQDSWGYYLFVRGRVNEAVVELEKAVALKPNESTILEHLGDAYLRSNLREKALRRYTDAVKFADDDTFKQKLEKKRDVLNQEIVQGGKSERTRMPASVPAKSP